MATVNQQSNNHRQSHRHKPQPNTHPSTYRRRGLSLSRCGNLNNTNVHVMQTNTHGSPPLEITNNTNNHIQQKNNSHTNNPINYRNHNNHKKPRKKRKTNMWIYLEGRMGFSCVLTDDIKAQGVSVPKDTIAMVKQDGKDTMPYIQFGKPFELIRWCKNIDKTKLTFC